MTKPNRLLEKLKKENFDLKLKNKELTETNDKLLQSCQAMEKELAKAYGSVNDISSHPDYVQMKKRVNELEDINKTLEERWKRASERSMPVVHNARGAGRHPKYTEEQVLHMKELKESGMSLRKIATEIGCSVGTVSNCLKNK